LKYLKRSKRKYRIVIDANVIISSIFGGYPAKVIEVSSSHKLFAPMRLKDELKGFLQKIEKRGDFTNLEDYFDYVLHLVKLVAVENPESISGDRTDDFYIAVALQKKVDFLITRDKDVLSCRSLRDWPFKILTPKEFVEIIEEED